MSRIGNSDCPTCKKWIAECQCNDHYPSNPPYEIGDIIFNEGDKIDAIMSSMTEEQQREMQEQCSDHFQTVHFDEPPF